MADAETPNQIDTTARPCPVGCGTWLDGRGRDANGTKHDCKRRRVTGTTRPIKPEEKEIMTVAGEIVRRRYSDDVSEALDDQMLRWAMRLRDAYDQLIEPIRVRR
jgi:hypothetical protein